MRLEEVIIQGQHRGMNRKAIKHAALVLQAVHAFGAQALEWIPTSSCRRASRLQGLKAGEFAIRKLNLGGRVQPLEDHVAVREYLVYEVLDRRVLCAWEERCAFAQLNTLVDQIWRWGDKRLGGSVGFGGG
jgi:hypothetical protein